ncbi:MAG: hypothetical protein NT154_36815 [Verrucomicrobia bacterium]|nr:hypothetical protein [Verrucomicrobiota bacterium]
MSDRLPVFNRNLLTILAAVAVSVALIPRAWSGDAEGRITPRASMPSYEQLVAGTWRLRPFQGKPFWFTLGGGEGSAVHAATLEQQPIADTGLLMYGVAEWGYSFHNLKNGQPDGAGYKHYGGYPHTPRTRADAAEMVKGYFSRLAADARAKAKAEELPFFSSVNGHYCYQHYGCEWGADVVGSEVGENINGIQAHIAFARGAARQYGKPWLIDFSSWYGPSMYDEDSRKTWGEYSGPDRGHSLSLHRRTYYLAYMSGASVVVAEGGWLNYFRSQKPGVDGTLPLSRLGKEGARFYAFTRRYPDRGITYTPVGLLIDPLHGIYPGFGEKQAWNAFPYTPGDQRILNAWEAFFPDSVEVIGKRNEKGYLVASPYGDILDVILYSAPEAILASYPVLILAGEITQESLLAERLSKYVRQGGTLVLSEADAKRGAVAGALELKPDLAGGGGTNYSRLERGRGVVVVCQEGGVGGGAQEKVLARLREELVPLQISGKVESLYNRTADGWLITLVNNEGITKSYNEPPRVDATPQVAAVRYTGPGSVRSVCLWTPEGDEPLDPADIHISIPPGEERVVRLALAAPLR